MPVNNVIVVSNFDDVPLGTLAFHAMNISAAADFLLGLAVGESQKAGQMAAAQRLLEESSRLRGFSERMEAVLTARKRAGAAEGGSNEG